VSRLVDVAALLLKLQRHRATWAEEALGTAVPENAAFEYGQKIGYNRGLLEAERQLNLLLKEEDDGRKPEQRQGGRTNAYA
jgi:hypothetical protein